MIRPRVFDAVAIVNPFGQIWSDKTFDTADEARDFALKHVKKEQIADFGTVNVVVTIAVKSETMEVEDKPRQMDY